MLAYKYQFCFVFYFDGYINMWSLISLVRVEYGFDKDRMITFSVNKTKK